MNVDGGYTNFDSYWLASITVLCGGPNERKVMKSNPNGFGSLLNDHILLPRTVISAMPEFIKEQ